MWENITQPDNMAHMLCMQHFFRTVLNNLGKCSIS